MGDPELYRHVLGLESPWTVSKVELSVEMHQVDVWAEHGVHTSFACPECGTVSGLHDHAQLSPWNAIGEVYRYRLVGKGYTLKDLKTAEDWLLERQFKQVQGVIDVTSYGGETKQYHVEVDPFRLHGYNVTLNQLETAITNSNQNVGGQRLFMGEQS
jgi:hypothetical protein